MKWTTVGSAIATAAFLAVSHSPAGARCEGDFDGNNAVAINELIRAVSNALSGCQDPLSMLGTFEGQGFEIRAGCTDPVPDGTFEVTGITLEVSQQDGSLYEGTLDLLQPGGMPLALDIEGTIDDEGFTRAQGFITGVPVPAARFQGRLLGDTLAIAVQIENPLCGSDAATFIGMRN